MSQEREGGRKERKREGWREREREGGVRERDGGEGEGGGGERVREYCQVMSWLVIHYSVI